MFCQMNNFQPLLDLGWKFRILVKNFFLFQKVKFFVKWTIVNHFWILNEAFILVDKETYHQEVAKMLKKTENFKN